MHVKEIMSKPAVTCRSTDRLDAAAKLMWDYDSGAVPVVDSDGTPIGIITDRDVAIAAYTKGRALADIRVEEAMARRLFTCREDQALDDAARTMREKQVRRLPVVDPKGQLVGLLSLNDIARHTATAQDATLDQELTRTLAAICQPRKSESRAQQERQRIAQLV